MTAKASPLVGLADLAGFLIAALLAPTVVTGIFRVLPDGWSGFVPFAAVLCAAAALGWRTAYRSVAVGLAAGTIAWAIFLYLVFASWSEGLRGL